LEQVNEILGKLKPFENKTVLVSNYQDSTDIINEILKAHVKYKNEYDKIAVYFWKGNIKNTCNYIYNYLKNNVDYIIEPDAKQTVKSPAAIIAQGYGDCKHYSLFTAGILDALRRSGKNINWSYRFANYKLFYRTPHHVFCVVNPKTKYEIWIDAVLENFNDHKEYVNAQDKNYKQMALYSISGIDQRGFKRTNLINMKKRLMQLYKLGKTNPAYKALYIKYRAKYRLYALKKLEAQSGFDKNIDIQSVAGLGCCGDSGTTSIDGIGRRSKAERKARRRSKREARRSGPNCKGRTGAKIALAIPRKAFLGLVRVNFRKMGQKVYLAMQDPETARKLYKKWCNMGGNAALLRRAATKAYLKAKRKGKVSGHDDQIGVITAAGIAAWWAASSPIIAAVTPILALAAKLAAPGSKGAEIAQQADSTVQQVSGHL